MTAAAASSSRSSSPRWCRLPSPALRARGADAAARLEPDALAELEPLVSRRIRIVAFEIGYTGW